MWKKFLEFENKVFTAPYKWFVKKGIVVRNSSKNLNCENTLRITVGLKEENTRLIDVLNSMDTK